MRDVEEWSLWRRGVLRGGRISVFVVGYLTHFLRSNYQVAKEILTPGSSLSPAVVTVPVRSRTAAELATYTSLINLSPGTVTLAVSEDRDHVTVHGMHAGDPKKFCAEMQGLEQRLLAAWRPVSPRGDNLKDGRRS